MDEEVYPDTIHGTGSGERHVVVLPSYPNYQARLGLWAGRERGAGQRGNAVAADEQCSLGLHDLPGAALLPSPGTQSWPLAAGGGCRQCREPPWGQLG